MRNGLCPHIHTFTYIHTYIHTYIVAAICTHIYIHVYIYVVHTHTLCVHATNASAFSHTDKAVKSLGLISNSLRQGLQQSFCDKGWYTMRLSAAALSRVFAETCLPGL